VSNDDVVSPASAPLANPDGVTGQELQAWQEVRDCLGVGAHTAAVMLCRKLLLHVAAAHGLPAKGDNDRAPGFYQAVQHLETEGIITRHMRPWVDRIKEVGNDASHELPHIERDDAMDVATFTEQLLRLAYELPARMARAEAGTGWKT